MKGMRMSTAAQEAVSNFNIDARIRTIAVTAAIVLAMTILAAPAAQAQTLSILHTFTGADGGSPYSGVTMDQAGNLYGTTATGGAGYGTVFKLSHKGAGWILNTLYTFQGGADGACPYARVVFGPDGALYGTTSDDCLGDGPSSGYGTVFSLRPPSNACPSFHCAWTKTVLYSFTAGSDGAYPGYGDLVFDAAGNIYGTTQFGGGAGATGVVFKLSRSGESWTESVLYSFSSTGNGGYFPQSGVILDSAGEIYGTTFSGGAYNSGVAFQLTHPGSSWVENDLHSFGAINDGSFPFGGLIMDQRGNLYGTTTEGPTGNNGGTVFELQPSGDSWTYSTLANLPGNTGTIGPTGALTMDAAGNLYGTTYNDVGAGNVFKLTPSGGSWTYTDLHDFNGHDGANPLGSVVLDAQGNLYGTTSARSNSNYGEVWVITP